MRKLTLLLALLTTLSFTTPAPLSAALIYRPDEGWNREDEDSGVAEKTASEQLRKAKNLEALGDFKRAAGAYRTLLRVFPNTGAAPQAQIKLAEAYLAQGETEKAFETYGKYISSYPRGNEFDKAVEGQFNIGKSFLQGEKRKLFGVKTFPSMERAQQMFEAVIKNAPFSRFAALAQFNIGQALEKQGKYIEAAAAYQTVTEKYPADEVSADAQYQIGYIYFRQAQAGSYDQTARMKAREAFEDFKLKFPNSEKVAQADQNIKTLDGKDTKQFLGIAQFYERTQNYKAAYIYYQDVVKSAPGTPEAAIAKKQLEGLEKSVASDKLRGAPEQAETGEKAAERRKLQAKVETASRPDYVGPPAPATSDTSAPEKPQLRTSGETPDPLAPSSMSLGPNPAAPEPPLPTN
jgi:outer membrane protein assembly factor BamD